MVTDVTITFSIQEPQGELERGDMRAKPCCPNSDPKEGYGPK